MKNTFTPFALKLHAFGLFKLQNPNYMGLEIYDHLKGHIRGSTPPKDLLQKTLDNGFLYHLGLWLYEKYLFLDYYNEEFFPEDVEKDYNQTYFSDVISHQESETWFWYLEDFIELIKFHSQTDTLLRKKTNESSSFLQAVELVEQIEKLFEKYYLADADKYFAYLDGPGKIEIIKKYVGLRNLYQPELVNFASNYAFDYADRVFHDRELCGFISELITRIAFGVVSDEEEPKQWIKRRTWPEWAKEALRARERGKCANCNKDLIQELEDDVHIDHIIPLSKGGCNDLVNLQILCKNCNLKKSNKLLDVNSSIPPYMKRRLLP